MPEHYWVFTDFIQDEHGEFAPSRIKCICGFNPETVDALNAHSDEFGIL